MLKFGSAKAKSGEKSTGELEAGEYRTGSEFNLPVAVINGRKPGDTLYIQSISDGDELNGVGVVSNIYQSIDPDEITGSILIVGILNIHGYQSFKHKNPVDGKKINRVFPGNKEGSSSERLADIVYKEGVKRADLGLDLHQGSTSKMIHEVRVRCGRSHHLHKKCLELAKAFGTNYILDKKGPEGQLARVAPKDDIPFVDPELGGSYGWSKDSIEIGVKGVYNVLKHYGFMEGEVEIPEEQYVATDFNTINSDRGGLIDFKADLYDKVEQGDKLFSITDVFGNEKETVYSDKDGVIWRMHRLPMVSSGEYVLSIATGVEEI